MFVIVIEFVAASAVQVEVHGKNKKKWLLTRNQRRAGEYSFKHPRFPGPCSKAAVCVCVCVYTGISQKCLLLHTELTRFFIFIIFWKKKSLRYRGKCEEDCFDLFKKWPQALLDIFLFFIYLELMKGYNKRNRSQKREVHWIDTWSLRHCILSFLSFPMQRWLSI